MQPWEDAKPNQTAVPFEREYLVRGTRTPILKQTIGMFKLMNGVEVHFQSFGIFNLTLWDDVMSKFLPLSKSDTIFVGMHSILRRHSSDGCQHVTAALPCVLPCRVSMPCIAEGQWLTERSP